MSIRSTHLFIAAAFCVATAFSAQGAPAAEASSLASPLDRKPFEFTYRFDAADLQTRSGSRRVYRGLVLQAQKACAESPSTLLDLHHGDRGCAAALVNDVVRKIDSPVLAALHARKTPMNGLAATPRKQDFVGSL